MGKSMLKKKVEVYSEKYDIHGVVWMALQSGKITSVVDMTPEQRVTLARIQNEPASIMPPE